MIRPANEHSNVRPVTNAERERLIRLSDAVADERVPLVSLGQGDYRHDLYEVGFSSGVMVGVLVGAVIVAIVALITYGLM